MQKNVSGLVDRLAIFPLAAKVLSAERSKKINRSNQRIFRFAFANALAKLSVSNDPSTIPLAFSPFNSFKRVTTILNTN